MIPKHREERRYQGIGVSPGMIRGPVRVEATSFTKPERYGVSGEEIALERKRREEALVETRRQITELQKEVLERSGSEHAGIFEAHLLVLEDHTVLDEVFETVEKEGVNVDTALWSVFQRYVESLRNVEDSYLRERAVDLEDVLRRILRNLRPGDAQASGAEDLSPGHPYILVAHDLSPSEMAAVDRERVLGVATEAGSRTSHAAIMARALDLPAVVGLGTVNVDLKNGDEVLLDGYGGILIHLPSDPTIEAYEGIEEQQAHLREELSTLIGKTATTEDGFRVVLSCNIEFAYEADRVRELGGEGVGLYRTEFFYLNRGTLPTEEQLAADYGRVAQACGSDGVIIRTLDAGGDKIASEFLREPEANPFLGWRGIRLCLGERELFHTQLRAVLRASAVGKVSLMFPMVGGLEEFREAKNCLERAREELRAEGVPFAEDLQVGVMMEVPSAVMLANSLAREADFLSVGTNDLVQYTLAVDRGNEQVSALYTPHHPAVLQLLQMVAEAARRHGIWAGVCGEMASDVVAIPLLVGLSMAELSVAPGQLLAVKRAIRTLNRAECQVLFEECVSLETAAEVRSRCLELARKRYPELLGQSSEYQPV